MATLELMSGKRRNYRVNLKMITNCSILIIFIRYYEIYILSIYIIIYIYLDILFKYKSYFYLLIKVSQSTLHFRIFGTSSTEMILDIDICCKAFEHSGFTQFKWA